MKQNKLLSIRMFLNTYTQRQIHFYKDFKKAEKLIKDGCKVSYIHKVKKIPKNRLTNWIRKNPRAPIIQKAIKRAIERNYLKIKNNSKKAECLAYLIGSNTGDGNISKDMGKALFCGKNKDLEKIARFIRKYFDINLKIYPYEKMYILDTTFIRLLAALGAPIGDKTTTAFSIPKWILKANKKVKKRFLQGLFDSELSIPRISKNRKTGLRALYFYQIKIKEKVKNGKRFLNQMKKILNEFDIKSSKNYECKSYKRKRDEYIAISLYFYIYGNKVNFLNFTKVGFFLNSERRTRTEKMSKTILKFLKTEVKKNEIYRKAMNLRKGGKYAKEIGIKFKIPKTTVESWFHKNSKPKYFYKEKEIKGLLNLNKI